MDLFGSGPILEPCLGSLCRLLRSLHLLLCPVHFTWYPALAYGTRLDCAHVRGHASSRLFERHVELPGLQHGCSSFVHHLPRLVVYPFLLRILSDGLYGIFLPARRVRTFGIRHNDVPCAPLQAPSVWQTCLG